MSLVKNTIAVTINLNRIWCWWAFHRVFAKAFGFPKWYGRNMDAWIDCMTHLDNIGDGNICTFSCDSGEKVTLRLLNHERFMRRHPKIWEALAECAEFVNERRVDAGESPLLILAFE